MESKNKNYKEVMSTIPDGAHIATTSFGFGGLPTQLLHGLSEYYAEQQHPKSITFSTTAGIGLNTDNSGLNLLLEPGLLKRFYGSHVLGSKKAATAALNNAFEFYFIPQGVIGSLYQDSGREQSGVFSKVGLNTFIDPRQAGGAMNDISTDEVSELVTLDDEEWIRYKPWNIDVAFIKATFADEEGNISIEQEPNHLEILELATAAHNNGGVVIVQVKEIVEAHSIPPQNVVIPKALVDHVVVAEPENHFQLVSERYDPKFSNEVRVDLNEHDQFEFSPMKVMARRITSEINKGDVVNVGYGLASKVSNIFSQAEMIQDIHLSTDLGTIGGLPTSDLYYGTSLNADAVLRTRDMFSLYVGGGLDVAILGFGQFDQSGNMNTSKLGGRLMGPGGMMDIAYGAKKVIFVGTFTVGVDLSIKDNKLHIEEEGKPIKFGKQVEYITYNAQEELKRGKEIKVITDRAIFDILPETGLQLIEVAPGVDMQKDVLDLLPFDVSVSENVKEMDSELFKENWKLTL